MSLEEEVHVFEFSFTAGFTTLVKGSQYAGSVFGVKMAETHPLKGLNCCLFPSRGFSLFLLSFFFLFFFFGGGWGGAGERVGIGYFVIVV